MSTNITLSYSVKKETRFGNCDMKILITGANGLLGQKIVKFCLHQGIDFSATSSGENRNPDDCPDENYYSMNITNKLEVENVIKTASPTHIIHTAAITNVDYCQLNPSECEEVNVEATKFLADICAQEDIHFQFLSTDFVFDGEKGNYSEEDDVNPVSIYGKSKADAEQYLIDGSFKNWSIVRTIIVYGTGNNLSRSNLIVWAKESLEKGIEMKIIDDQFRAPTFVDDLALACIAILRNNKKGIFNIAGPKAYSIFEIVNKVAQHFGYSMNNVHRISSETLNQPAKRPPKTGFNLTKAKSEINYEPRTIEESLSLIFK